jgi:KaiC/GvpD/RAD55 family RecA-like ATPase
MLYSSLVFSQGYRGEKSPEMRAKIEAQKISFITQQLDLRPEEAQQFWPLYNEMKNKKEAFQKEFRQLFRNLKQGSENLSEGELIKISDRMADLKVDKAKMEREYHYKFKKVLSAKQILDLHLAEKQFQGMLLRRIKGEGGRQRQRGRN